MALNQNNPPFDLLTDFTSVVEFDFQARTGEYTDGVDTFTEEYLGSTPRIGGFLFGNQVSQLKNYLMPTNEDWVVVSTNTVPSDLDQKTTGPFTGNTFNVGTSKTHFAGRYSQDSIGSATAKLSFRAYYPSPPSGDTTSDIPDIGSVPVTQGDKIYFRVTYTASTRSYTLEAFDAVGTTLIGLSSNVLYGSASGDNQLSFSADVGTSGLNPSIAFDSLNFNEAAFVWVGKRIQAAVEVKAAKPTKLLGRKSLTGRRASRASPKGTPFRRNVALKVITIKPPNKVKARTV